MCFFSRYYFSDSPESIWALMSQGNKYFRCSIDNTRKENIFSHCTPKEFKKLFSKVKDIWSNNTKSSLFSSVWSDPVTSPGQFTMGDTIEDLDSWRKQMYTFINSSEKSLAFLRRQAKSPLEIVYFSQEVSKWICNHSITYSKIAIILLRYNTKNDMNNKVSKSHNWEK